MVSVLIRTMIALTIASCVDNTKTKSLRVPSNDSWDHVLVYPSDLLKNNKYFGVYETSRLPVRDMRWKKILHLNSTSNYIGLVAHFKPRSRVSLFQIIETVSTQLSPRVHHWCPTILFEWPSKITIKSEEHNGTGKMDAHRLNQKIRRMLVEQVAPLTRKSFEISLNIYFVFKIGFEFGETLELVKTFCELYYMNGNDEKESNLVVQEVSSGSWQDGRVERRGDLRKAMLTVVAPNEDDIQSEFTWKSLTRGNKTLVSGISLKILQDLQDSLNFRMNIIEGDWVSQFPNGTLKGITAYLLRNRKVDLFVGQTVPIPRRTTIMDHLQPTSQNMLRAYVHQPRASAFRDIYTIPFKVQLWLAVFTVWCLILCSVYIVSKTLSHQNNMQPRSNDSLSSGDVFIWLVGTVSQQGWHLHPTSFSLRGIFITASLTGLISYIAYAAQMVSVLSLENVPIQNLNDLFNSSLPLHVTTESITVLEIVKKLRPETNRDFHKVPKSIGVYFTFNFPGGFAIYSHHFHEERQKQGFPDHVACGLIHSFPVTKVPLPSSMGIPKDAPLREYFNHKILKMRERGFVAHYMTQRFYSGGLDCNNEKTKTRYREDLEIDDISTSIIILAFGYTLSVGFFICEHIYLQRKKRQMISILF